MMNVSIATRRNPAVSVLFIGGAILLASGLAATSIVQIATALETGSGPLPTLPESAYTGYRNTPHSPGPLVFDTTLMTVFLGIAALGVLVLAAAVIVRRVRSLPVWLLVPGVLMALGGSIGGLVAKHSADITSLLASQPKGLISGGAASSMGLRFDPSSAHFVPPNYAGLWLGIMIAAVGTVLGVTGAFIAIRQKRPRTITQ